MKNTQSYLKRASECLAFARTARNEAERGQLLMMARALMNFAHEKQRKSSKLGEVKLPNASPDVSPGSQMSECRR
jgi:hypothetical protein